MQIKYRSTAFHRLFLSSTSPIASNNYRQRSPQLEKNGSLLATNLSLPRKIKSLAFNEKPPLPGTSSYPPQTALKSVIRPVPEFAATIQPLLALPEWLISTDKTTPAAESQARAKKLTPEQTAWLEKNAPFREQSGSADKLAVAKFACEKSTDLKKQKISRPKLAEYYNIKRNYLYTMIYQLQEPTLTHEELLWLDSHFIKKTAKAVSDEEAAKFYLANHSVLNNRSNNYSLNNLALYFNIPYGRLIAKINTLRNPPYNLSAEALEWIENHSLTEWLKFNPPEGQKNKNISVYVTDVARFYVTHESKMASLKISIRAFACYLTNAGYPVKPISLAVKIATLKREKKHSAIELIPEAERFIDVIQLELEEQKNNEKKKRIYAGKVAKICLAEQTELHRLRIMPQHLASRLNIHSGTLGRTLAELKVIERERAQPLAPQDQQWLQQLKLNGVDSYHCVARLWLELNAETSKRKINLTHFADRFGKDRITLYQRIINQRRRGSSLLPNVSGTLST